LTERSQSQPQRGKEKQRSLGIDDNFSHIET